ncbi:hypothetical protein [Embleya scabrispora]|uniref:hypothetical protein n=1 Tax=Embleya scabrispora TaxID=159449 RepID=UPI001319D56D|nr:hypothetical protein [Embleya scabrispora]MYS80329.1 hypothetical protein [Streptomyces sp. SID5474]
MIAPVGPRLAEVFPTLARDIVEMLGTEEDGHALASTIGDLVFLARCPCRPDCDALLTASFGSSGSGVVTLQRDDDIIWLWLDDSGAIAWIKVPDHDVLGPGARRTDPAHGATSV